LSFSLHIYSWWKVKNKYAIRISLFLYAVYRILTDIQNKMSEKTPEAQ
jgi:hypothetical protein